MERQLKENQVLMIKGMLKENLISQVKIAGIMGCSKDCISLIKRGKIYKEIINKKEGENE